MTQKATIKNSIPSRRIEFIGTYKDDSIVIGNYGDARFIAQGNFELSGLIFCSKNTVVTAMIRHLFRCKNEISLKRTTLPAGKLFSLMFHRRSWRQSNIVTAGAVLIGIS